MIGCTIDTTTAAAVAVRLEYGVEVVSSDFTRTMPVVSTIQSELYGDPHVYRVALRGYALHCLRRMGVGQQNKCANKLHLQITVWAHHEQGEIQKS